MKQPDFIIIGAMKSATSSLHVQLGAQDGIFMSEPKEPCYFIDLGSLESPAREVVESWGFWRGEEHYLALFRDAGAAKIVGPTGTVFGFDPNPGMLREARKKFDGPLTQGVAQTLPFADDREWRPEDLRQSRGAQHLGRRLTGHRGAVTKCQNAIRQE